MLTANTTICKHFSPPASAILGKQRIFKLCNSKAVLAVGGIIGKLLALHCL